MKILYIGRFVLPDKDATANRVVSNAKLFRALGHEVALAGWSDETQKNSGWRESSHFGFTCFEKHKEKTSRDKMRTFFDGSPEIELLKKYPFDMVIAYNFPAVALRKIMKFCANRQIKCIGDVTEWYANRNKNLLFKIVRMYDSFLRMRVLHKKMDGLIVISRYLEEYYRCQKTVRIPPLIDLDDEKWELRENDKASAVRFVYAGCPSKRKERLDLIIESMRQLEKTYCVQLDVFGVTAQKYSEIYDVDVPHEKNIIFHGKVSHSEAVNALKSADYSFIIRDASRKNNAGFPSKLVESIGSGTPVLVTEISNVRDYVGDGKNGYIVSIDTLTADVAHAIEQQEQITVDRKTFDYRNYIESLSDYLAQFQ